MEENLKKFIVMLCMCAVVLSACASTKADDTKVRVAGLKGPTTMGLLFLQEKSQQGKAQADYEFNMMTSADEILPLMIKGEMDIALIPANAASILYQKTNGEITVIDINTLGVLYLVSADDSINTPKDLKGKTIYLTGKGTTPDYVLHYILKTNGISEDECTLEYKSEATEIAAILSQNQSAIGLLPQPFVTAACAQNEALNVVMDMTQEWEQAAGASSGSLVTGVTVVRKDFLDEHEELVKIFMQEHEESTQAINEDTAHGAELAVSVGIVAKEQIAKKAIPECNITYIDGTEMKQALEGYLRELYEQNPQSVGGELPGEDFYYIL